MVSIPAAHATGFPPKVLACEPGAHCMMDARFFHFPGEANRRSARSQHLGPTHLATHVDCPADQQTHLTRLASVLGVGDRLFAAIAGSRKDVFL